MMMMMMMMAVMMMQWNSRINGILYQCLLYPDTGYVCLFMLAARLAVSCCFRQLNAKHSVLVFRRILDTTKRLRQAMEHGIFIL
jgi:predicted LPLAT superfamily acyltransferase